MFAPHCLPCVKKSTLILYIVFIEIFQSFGQPTISSFAPEYGPPGTVVTITGSNYNVIPTENHVFFGPVKATVISATSTSLTVMVPIGATHQPFTVTSSRLTTYSPKPFSVTSEHYGIMKSDAFDSKVYHTIPEATTVLSMAASDLNDDGRTDLIMSDRENNQIILFRNTGSPGTVDVSNKLSITTGSRPSFVIAGDINGDGKPDLCVINSGEHTVSVFKNTSTTGSITFEPKVDFPTGTTPHSLAIHDVDGDGKNDLVCTNSAISTFSVLRNTIANEIISFAAKVDFPTGELPRSLTITDLSGDGKPDIALSNFNSNVISVYKNNSVPGSISFSTNNDIGTGIGPRGISSVDLDNDGKQDLVVTNFTSQTVSLLRNNSTGGSISFEEKVDLENYIAPVVVVTTEINGDRKPDLLVSCTGTNDVTVFQNLSSTGSLSFVPLVRLTSKATYALACADMDMNGTLDIVGFNYLGNVNNRTLNIMLNRVTAEPPVIDNLSKYSAIPGASIVISGKNFNPLPDKNFVSFGATRAIVTSSTTTSMTVIVPFGATYSQIAITNERGTGYSKNHFSPALERIGKLDTSSFDAPINFSSTTGNFDGPAYISKTDFDGDGKVDMLVGNGPQNASFSIFRNLTQNGSISFAIPVVINMGLPPYSGPQFIETADLNADGKPDLIVSDNSSPGTVRFYRNTSTVGNISLVADLSISVRTPVRLVTSNFNSDGKPDVAIFNQSDGQIALFKNISISNKLLFDNAGILPSEFNTSKLKSGDINGDGKDDLIVTTYTGALDIYLNNSSGYSIRFLTSHRLSEFMAGEVAIGDLDGDRKNELVYVRRGDIIVLKNLSSESSIQFGSAFTIPNVYHSRSLTLADIDGDGLTDITASEYGSFAIIRNKTSSGNLGFDKVISFNTSGGQSFTLADFNGDVKLDFAFVHELITPKGTVSVLRNRMMQNVESCAGSTLTFTAPLTGNSYKWQIDSGNGYVDLNDNTFYSGSNTSTLQIRNIPSSYHGYKIRSVTDNIVGNSYVLQFINKWTGSVSAHWENPVNWSCGIIPDANTDVLIESGNLIVNSNVIVRSLTINAGATVTVSVGFQLIVIK